MFGVLFFVFTQWQKKGFSHQLYTESEAVGEGIALGDAVPEDDREQFILDNQWAFKYGTIEEFGKRDAHIDFDGEIISRRTIERCIDASNSKNYRS